MTGLRMSDRYTNFWRFVFDPAQVEDMDHLITTLESFAEALPQMRKWRDAGIQVDDVQGKLSLAEGYIGFFTDNAAVAAEFGFDKEDEE